MIKLSTTNKSPSYRKSHIPISDDTRGKAETKSGQDNNKTSRYKPINTSTTTLPNNSNIKPKSQVSCRFFRTVGRTVWVCSDFETQLSRKIDVAYYIYTHTLLYLLLFNLHERSQIVPQCELHIDVQFLIGGPSCVIV